MWLRINVGDGAFEPEEEEEQAVSSESDSEDYEESDGSADVVDELEGDSAEGEEELSSDEEGLDWDELEAKAAKVRRQERNFERSRVVEEETDTLSNSMLTQKQTIENATVFLIRGSHSGRCHKARSE